MPNIDELSVVVVVFSCFVVWVVALVDVTRRRFQDTNTKLLWVLLVVLLHDLGAVLYLVIGRKQGYIAGPKMPSTF